MKNSRDTLDLKLNVKWNLSNIHTADEALQCLSISQSWIPAGRGFWLFMAEPSYTQVQCEMSMSKFWIIRSNEQYVSNGIRCVH
jgi:hypothetical protein